MVGLLWFQRRFQKQHEIETWRRICDYKYQHTLQSKDSDDPFLNGNACTENNDGLYEALLHYTDGSIYRSKDDLGYQAILRCWGWFRSGTLWTVLCRDLIEIWLREGDDQTELSSAYPFFLDFTRISTNGHEVVPVDENVVDVEQNTKCDRNTA